MRRKERNQLIEVIYDIYIYEILLLAPTGALTVTVVYYIFILYLQRPLFEI